MVGCKKCLQKRYFERHKIDFKPGTKYGQWTILSDVAEMRGRVGGKSAFFLARCDCGNEKYVNGSLMKNGYTTMCKGCVGNNRVGDLHDTWKGCGGLTGSHFGTIRKRALEADMEFAIDIEFLWELFQKQEGKCALSGIDIQLPQGSKNGRNYVPKTASLDRIDSSKGYTKDNVQWVHKDYNQMKMDFDEERFFQRAKVYVKFQEKKRKAIKKHENQFKETEQ